MPPKGTRALQPGATGPTAAGTRVADTPLEAALRYAASGLPVLLLHSVHDGRCTCERSACTSPGKHPRTPHGFKDGTTDELAIRAWWQNSLESNVGIIPGPGIAVLDVDPRNGGSESLAELERAHGSLPATATVATGGGGRHFYFQLPEGKFRKRNGFRPGLDLLLGEGYVIVPPSLHVSGTAYRWLAPLEQGVAPIPSWLIEAADGRHVRADGPEPGGVGADRIPCGRRHATLTSHAGTMRRRGMPAEAIEAGLLEENRLRCDPPLEEEEVRTIAGDISKYPPAAKQDREQPPMSQGKQRTQATVLVELASAAELFHTPEDKAFATIPVGDHRETRELRSRGFRVWLARRFYQAGQKPPGSQAMHSALDVLEGQALHDGPAIPVFTRLAEHGGEIYLDLANEAWEVVEIAGDGWRVLSSTPVKFRRPKALLPLPRPAPGGHVGELFRFANVRDEADRALLLGAVVASMRPRGPYPVVVLTGEQGSAKTFTGRLLSDLVDPSRAGLRAEPREVRDLMIAAVNSHLLALDNLSSLSVWLSDALCRLSTGGAFTTRELYSDQEETILEAQRPVILTGIEVPITRADLLERSLIIQLPPISDSNRKPEEELRREFEAARPRILGAFLTAVSAALRRLPMVHLADSPRMADFARWVTAAEGSLDLQPGTFMRAYTGNREATNDLALESSPIVPSLLALADDGPWIGSPGELLKELESRSDEATRRQKGWPSCPRGMRSALQRVLPNLRAIGVEVTFPPRQRNLRPIRVERIGQRPSPPSSPSLDLTTPLRAPPAGRVSRDGAGDGVPLKVTEGGKRPSRGCRRDGGVDDGGDGGDGRPQADSDGTPSLGMADSARPCSESPCDRFEPAPEGKHSPSLREDRL